MPDRPTVSLSRPEIRRRVALAALKKDIDAAGLAIVGFLAGRFRCRPWRMDPFTYASRASGPPIDPPASRFFPELAVAMGAAGRAVYEEDLIEELLTDLAG